VLALLAGVLPSAHLSGISDKVRAMEKCVIDMAQQLWHSDTWQSSISVAASRELIGTCTSYTGKRVPGVGPL
jgi:hypothetical protein